jgi:hypothetical protein
MPTVLDDIGRCWMMLGRRGLPELEKKRSSWSGAAAARRPRGSRDDAQLPIPPGPPGRIGNFLARSRKYASASRPI